MAIVSLLIIYYKIITTIHIRDQHIILHHITSPTVATITTIPIRHTIRPIIRNISQIIPNISQDLKQIIIQAIIQAIIRVTISQDLVRITHIEADNDIHMYSVAI